MSEIDPKLQEVFDRLAIISEELFDETLPPDLTLISREAPIHTDHHQPHIPTSSYSTILNFPGIAQMNVKQRLIHWVESTKSLNRTDLIRLKRLALFKFNADGRLILRQPIIPSQLAITIITLTVLLAGIQIGWILLTPRPDLQMCCNSLAIGLVCGYVISMTLDLSFRHQDMMQKLSQLAPQLNQT